MGYHTEYTLANNLYLDPNGWSFSGEMAWFEFDPLLDCWSMTTTWYDWREDMKEFSLRHPGVLFTLEGEGSSPGDSWIAYFKDGKMQECRAKITYDEYDPEKMV